MSERTAVTADVLAEEGFSGKLQAKLLAMVATMATAAAKVKAGQSDDAAIADLALAEWLNDDSADTTEYRELTAAIESAESKLATLKSRVQDIVDANIGDRINAVRESASKSGAAALKEYRDAHTSFMAIVKAIVDADTLKTWDIPKVKGIKSNVGPGAGAKRYRLAEAFVNGEPVPFSGKHPTFGDINKAIGSNATSQFWADQVGNVATIPTDGVSFDVKVNDNTYTIYVKGRATEDKTESVTAATE